MYSGNIYILKITFKKLLYSLSSPDTVLLYHNSSVWLDI